MSSRIAELLIPEFIGQPYTFKKRLEIWDDNYMLLVWTFLFTPFHPLLEFMHLSSFFATLLQTADVYESTPTSTFLSYSQYSIYPFLKPRKARLLHLWKLNWMIFANISMISKQVITVLKKTLTKKQEYIASSKQFFLVFFYKVNAKLVDPFY